MRNLKKDAIEMAARREAILREGFRLFAERSIVTVKMTDIAKAAGIGIATLYRYYPNKTDLVVAISADQWSRFMADAAVFSNDFSLDEKTAAECFGYYLDQFILLYRNYKELLRFNQDFNSYVRFENVDQERLMPYFKVIEEVKSGVHTIYEKARFDGTLSTELTEEQLFTFVLHIMLAAVTRYAVGLVYEGGNDPESELVLLRDILVNKFTAKR